MVEELTVKKTVARSFIVKDSDTLGDIFKHYLEKPMITLLIMIIGSQPVELRTDRLE